MTQKQKRTNIGAIPILPDWAAFYRPYAILTLSALLFLAPAASAYVGPVTLNLTTDDYGSDTSWFLTDSEKNLLAYGSQYKNNTTHREVINLPIGTGYTFTIADSVGNGIFSPGGYSLEDADGTVIVSGGASIPTMGESMIFDINDTSLFIAGNPATRAGVGFLYSFTPTVYGSNGGSLVFSINKKPAWATFDTNTGELAGTPEDSHLGGTTTAIEISVSNNSKTVTLTPFELTVVENAPPTIAGTPMTTVKVGWTYNFTPTANDPDGDTLTFSITNKPDWAFIDSSTGTLIGTPFIGDGTLNNIEISVSDGIATATLAAFDLTVLNMTRPYLSKVVDVEQGPVAIAFNHQTNKTYVANARSDSVTVIDGDTLKTHTVAVGDFPTALAIDLPTNKIYVVNINSDNVTVIDGDTLQTTTVDVEDSPMAIAIHPSNHQIYVANSESDNVTVIDADTLKTTTVAVGDYPTALAIHPSNNLLYVANFGSDNVMVIDINTLQITTTVAVGDSPKALAIHPSNHQIYVANYFSHNVTVIEVDTLKTNTVAVGNSPTALAVHPSNNQIYVANLFSNNVTVIDADTLQTTTVSMIGPPRALAIHSSNNQIYVANGDYVMVIDADTLQTTNVGATGTFPAAFAVDPSGHQIYVANSFSNNVAVIDADPPKTATTVAVGDKPSAIAIHPSNHQIYVANSESDNVTVIEADTNQTTFVPVGDKPSALAIHPSNHQIYVANSESDNVTVIDANTLNTAAVAVGDSPIALAIHPSNHQIYVANSESDNVTVIDANTLKTATVVVGDSPIAIAIHPSNHQIYVANSESDNVTIIDADTLKTTTVPVGDSPTALVIHPSNHQIYVANKWSNNVTVMDANTLKTTTVTVEDYPTALAIHPSNHQIYVANEWSHNVTVIDADTLKTTAVAVGNYPTALAIHPTNHQIYVAHLNGNNVTVIDPDTLKTTTVAVEGSPTVFDPTALVIHPDNHRVYVVNPDSDNVTVITPSQVTHSNPLPVEINPLPDNKTSLLTPAVVSFQTTDDIAKIYYQLNSVHGNSKWLNATLTDNNSGQAIIAQSREMPLPRGTYFLRAFATDDQMEIALSNATGANSPFIGEISTYVFKVVPSPIALDNSDVPHLTAIDEDIEPAENTGTLIAELLATGANNDPIADGDYDAVEGIAVIAVDNTNGRWEYSIDNGTTWTAFGTPSETSARLLLDASDNRIRFLPAMNFNGIVENGITFRAWEQITGGGDNGGTVDITDTELDPYALSPETETASITVTDMPEQFTGLSLETSAATILQSETVSIVGKLSIFPETGEDLSGHDIVLTITAPDGQTQVTQTTTTNTNTGQFAFKDLSLLELFNPMQEGAFGWKATFAATRFLAESESVPQAVLVGSSAGYAILVQGKIANEEGLEAHNKTIHRIYQKLKERGFEDDNLKYFNYNIAQDGVDGLPLKSDIEAAFTELKDRLSSNPAPFYVIMIDHGGSDGSFHIYNGNNDAFDDVIKPTELAGWMDNLEEGQSPNVLAKPRLVILGSCYSGSFIPDVSGEGRIIVTSATASEESYKGPEEPDGIRSGEYFMEEFFGRLGRSDNVKAAFEWATERTELLTRRGDSSANSTNRFNDNAAQHPLLDDNGDGKGSNSLATDGDGLQAAEVLLGVGLNYDTNAAGNPAEILSVSDTVYLTADEDAATLMANVNDANRVSSAIVDIRPPSVQLRSAGTEQSEQLEIPDLQREFLGCDGQTNRCATYFGDFTEPGKYEAFYFVRDTQTKEISPIKRSVIYKDQAGNTPPNAFDVVLPTHDSEQKTVVLFNWKTTTDPDDNQAVTYNLILSEDEDFGTVVYKQEELTNAMTFLDETAVMKDGTLGLKDKTTYYWIVEAVDPFGAKTESRSVFSFTTNNTNKPPSHVNLSVENHTDSQLVSNVQIDYYRADTQVTPDAHVQDQNRALTQIESGQYTVNVTADGYEPQQFQVDTRTGSIDTTVALTPTNPILNYGQLQFAIGSTRVGEAQGTVNMLVKRVGGSDGIVSVDYATANETATAGSDYTAQSGTLTWDNNDERAKPINLPITDDSDYEGNETFTVTLSNPTGGSSLGTINPLSVTIVENEAEPPPPPPEPGVLQFAATTYTAKEEDGLLAELITVTRVGGSDGFVSVEYLGTSESTALEGSDYRESSGRLNWADGETGEKTLNLTLIDDPEVENTEIIKLTLANPTGGATLGTPAQATLSITDNDVPQNPGTLQFTEATYTAGEGDGDLSLTVTRLDGSDGSATVQYLAMPESSATADSDYTGASGTLTWPAGDSEPKPLPITVIDDTDSEQSTETIQFTLSNPTGATLGSPAQATLSIIDNDTAPPILNAGVLQFGEATYTANESDGELNITVIRSGGSDGEVTVEYNAAESSTATVDSDYTGNQGTLTWDSADMTDKSLIIKLIDDTQVEGTELITLVLGTPTGGATLGSPIHATVTLADNDTSTPVTPPEVITPEPETPATQPGVLQFAAATYTAEESEGELTNITVTRTGGSEGSVTVQYLTTGESTATSNSDYTGTNGTLAWANGDTEPKSLTVTLIDDEQVEESETVKFTLSNPIGGAALGNQTAATLSIIDNDTAAPVSPAGSLQFSAPTYLVKETEGELDNIIVTRSGGSSGSVSVEYLATAEGSATVGSDYTNANGILTWADGDSEPKPISLTLKDDDELEPAETVHLKLFEATGEAELGNPAQAQFVIVDNEGDPLAPLGQGFTIGCPDETCSVTTQFRGGSTKEIAPDYQATLSISPSQRVLVRGDMEVEAAHVGQPADLLVVIYSQPLEESQTDQFLMVDSEQHMLEWAFLKDDDINLAALVAAYQDVTLVENQPVALYQGVLSTQKAHLLIYFGYRLQHNGQIVFNGEQPIQVRIGLDNELSSLGFGTTVFCPNDDCPSLTTAFKGGASVNEQDYQSTLTISPNQLVNILGQIDVDAAHVDQKADILVVAGLTPAEAESTGELFFMLDNQKIPQLWDGDPEKLVAAIKDMTLAASVPVEIYQGGLVDGQIRVFFGYRLENGMVVFNGEQVIDLRVEKGNN